MIRWSFIHVWCSTWRCLRLHNSVGYFTLIYENDNYLLRYDSVCQKLIYLLFFFMSIFPHSPLLFFIPRRYWILHCYHSSSISQHPSKQHSTWWLIRAFFENDITPLLLLLLPLVQHNRTVQIITKMKTGTKSMKLKLKSW